MIDTQRRIAKAANCNVQICSYCKFIVTLWSLISKSMILSVMNIYGFISCCTIHYTYFLVKGTRPHRRAGQMILPVRSFPRGKSNQLPFTGYSCIYPGTGSTMQVIVTIFQVPRVILIRGDNQEGWMKLLGSVEPFVDEAPLTTVGRFVVSNRPDLSVLCRNVENRSLLQSPLN